MPKNTNDVFIMGVSLKRILKRRKKRAAKKAARKAWLALHGTEPPQKDHRPVPPGERLVPLKKVKLKRHKQHKSSSAPLIEKLRSNARMFGGMRPCR